MAHNSVETQSSAPQPPPVPERMDIETDWPETTPDGKEVKVELWSDRERRDAELRILRGPILGTITKAATPEEQKLVTPDAIVQFGTDWVESQIRSASQSLAIRWSASSWRR